LRRVASSGGEGWRVSFRNIHAFSDSSEENSRMFITPAYAQGAAGGSDFLINLMPIILMFVIFYFLLFRPQQQRMKQHREMLANLRRGDTVVTSGGIIGEVTKVVDDREVEVKISNEVRVRVVRGMISEVRQKGEAVKEGA
jgi:preprotein translocase subunit YajC